MAHNGGIFQTGFNFLQIDGAYPFLNHCKTSQTPSIFGVGTPDPDNVNADNYIINTAGAEEFGFLFFIPDQTQRPGDYVVKWDGGGVSTVFNIGWLGTVTEGSNTGANGRFKVALNPAGEPYLNGRTILIYKNPSPNTVVTNVRFVHEDDETALDGGSVFSTLFKQEIVAKGFGMLRDLDWKGTNLSNLVKWEHRTRTTSCSYQAEQMFHDLWAGATVKTGTTYAVGAPSGWATLEHGRQVIVRWDVDGTSGANFSDFLNVGGTGAKAISDFRGDASTVSDARLMRAGKYSCLFYDADLDKWLKKGGDTDTGDRFIAGGVPFELFVQLCVEVGAHPWIVQPYLSADPVSNLMSNVALYIDNIRTTQATWMTPRYELVANECWNNANAFPGTRYAWNKANDRWGSTFDEHNYYGRNLSLNAQAIWTALGVAAKTPSRFKIVCAVQTFGSTSTSEPRLASTRHVLDGGTAAENYADIVACANYTSIDQTQTLLTQELQLAVDYDAAATQGEKDAIADDYIAAMASNLATLKTQYATWKAWAESHGIDGFEPYEGGYSNDFTASDLSCGVTGITRGAATVISTTGRIPPVGMSVTPTVVGGTTGLNGNTYTVTANSATTFTLNVDSSGMGAWTSGGTMTFEDSKEPVNVLRHAARERDAVKIHCRANLENFFRVGGRFPSKFMFAGDTGPNTAGQQIWAGFFPDIYGTTCKEMDMLEEMNADATPISFTIQT